MQISPLATIPAATAPGMRSPDTAAPAKVAPAGPAAATIDAVRGTMAETLTSPESSVGAWAGDVAGDYRFTMVKTTPIENSTWLRFEGQGVVDTKDGQLLLAESGYLDTASHRLFYTSTVTGGTGRYHDATGVVAFQGDLDLSTGRGQTSYTGFVSHK